MRSRGIKSYINRNTRRRMLVWCILCYARGWFKARPKARGLECELFDGCVPDLLRKSRMACEYADGLKWTDIDFKDDIDRAKGFCGEL